MIRIKQAMLMLAEALYRESADRHDIVIVLGHQHEVAFTRELAKTVRDMEPMRGVVSPDVAVLNGHARIVVRRHGGDRG